MPEATDSGQTVEDIYFGIIEDIEDQYGKKAAQMFKDGFHDGYTAEGLSPFWEGR